MSAFNFLKRTGHRSAPHDAADQADRGILVFENTSEVIQAETVLKQKGWDIHVMGPPPEVRRGCDLVIEFPLIEELRIVDVLRKEGIPPLQVVPVTSPLLQPVDIFQIKDFGRYLMVRAANMKLTVDKTARTIVNISGGGCPDVPCLASSMIGHTIDTLPGFLCALKKRAPARIRSTIFRAAALFCHSLLCQVFLPSRRPSPASILSRRFRPDRDQA